MNKKEVVIVAGIIAIIVLLVFQKQPKPVYPIAPVKVIENRIAGKEKEIHHFETKVGDEKKIIAAIGRELNALRLELENVKSKKDTIQIIQIQDTFIDTLTKQNKHLFTTIDLKDSIILAQRYIINNQDTIIKLSKQDIKRVKRQRNRSIAVNVAQGLVISGLLFKK